MLVPFDLVIYWLHFLLLFKEEEALIAAHRKEIEETMEIVREVCLCNFYFQYNCDKP